MTNPTKNNFSKSIWAITLAVAGIAIPITWGWWSTKSDLTLSKEQTTNIIEKKTSVDGLSIRYFDREIESLSKTIHVLKNTGRTPIEKNDLVSPPTLTIKEGELLDASIAVTKPSNLGAPLEKTNNEIKISFPLLNPGDSIEISTLVSGQNPTFSIESRIKNISAINNIDSNNQIKIRTTLPWSTYPVALFTLLGLAVMIGLIIEIPKLKRAIKTVHNGSSPIHTERETSIIHSYIKNELSFLTKIKKEELYRIASQHGSHITEDDKFELEVSIKNYLKNESPAGGAFLVFILVAAGMYYIAKNILMYP